MIRRVNLLLLVAAAFPAAGLLAQSAPSAPQAPPAAAPVSGDSNPAVFATPAPGSSQPAPDLSDSSQSASSQYLSNEDLHGDTPRIKSSELAQALSDSLPKYQAPKPQPAAKPEPDEPKNGIIRLPNYVVKEERPPVFTEKQLYTKQGLTDLNISRDVGLDPSKMPSPLAANITRFLFAAGANQNYEDALRQQSISDAGDMAQNAAIAGDPGESEFIKRVSNDTYLRSANDSDQGTGNASVAHMNDDEAGWGAPVPPPR